MWTVTHTHNDGHVCSDPHVVIPEEEALHLKALLNDVTDCADAFRNAGSFTGEFKDRIWTAEPWEDTGLPVADRVVWMPEYPQYRQALVADWDRIPEPIKSHPRTAEVYNEEQNRQVFMAGVLAFVRATDGVVNVRLENDGVVSGLDLNTYTKYTFTPDK